MTAVSSSSRSLSVIITSFESRPIVERCLETLVRQPAAVEIVVADCSPEDPTEGLRAAYPQVRVLHFNERRTVPQLRWAAVAHTTGDIVAAIEGRSVPADDWVAALLDGHARSQAPAVGGPVALKPDASRFDWGLYFSEFGLFAPPIPEGDVDQLSGANLSYKRHALDASRDLLEAGEWEAMLHERWLRSGQKLWMSSGAVVFHNGMTVPNALRMRFHYGWSYAAGRFRPTAIVRRVAYSALSPALPIVLTWRAARCALGRGLARSFWRSLPWTFGLNVAWSAGELAGYLFGRPMRPHIY